MLSAFFPVPCVSFNQFLAMDYEKILSVVLFCGLREGKRTRDIGKKIMNRNNLLFIMDFYWSSNDGVSLIESHLSKASFLNLQLLPTLCPRSFRFFAKRWVVRTLRFKYSAASCDAMISFIRITPNQEILFRKRMASVSTGVH